MGYVSVAAVVVAAMATLVSCQARLGGSCVDGNGQAGTCVTIRSCPPLRELLQALITNTAPPNGFQILRESVCSLQRNSEPLMCCADSRTGGGGSGGGGGGGSGIDLLPKQCGVTGLVDRIIDGEDAPLLAWPWMALIRGRVPGQPNTWICGGVLINTRYVLTAAHCFKSSLRVQVEFVRIGEHTLSTAVDCQLGVCSPPAQDIVVEQIIQHPEYESPCKECNDIALLRLSRPAQLHTFHVAPICLPVDPPNDMGFSEAEFQGKFAYAAGWGSTSRNPLRPTTPNVLQQVLLPIHEGDFCRRLKNGYPNNRSTLCAGGEGKDTCKGDSGGPLMLGNRFETKRFVVGITSLGPTVCGRQSTQALYTNVHFYVPWILQTLRP
uniref:CLIP domain-containing serine protease n=1 Tax=Callinectes sapidus TaxID=6763 RepID=Q0PZI6_CALSI|nr:prophenoloxidase activating enzyme III [Callinectes sapidus]